MTSTSRSVAAPVVLRILSDPIYLSIVRSAAERFCELAGLDHKSAQAVGLALDEALANVIRHGYDGRPNQPIHIEFDLRRPGHKLAEDGEPACGELRICVRDFGRQVDSAQINPRQLDDIQPGGLGVHIMRTVMDQVQYRRRGLTGMELEMTKTVADPSIDSGSPLNVERSSRAPSRGDEGADETTGDAGEPAAPEE